MDSCLARRYLSLAELNKMKYNKYSPIAIKKNNRASLGGMHGLVLVYMYYIYIYTHSFIHSLNGLSALTVCQAPYAT